MGDIRRLEIRAAFRIFSGLRGQKTYTKTLDTD
jgi:hypothetical protein